MGLDIGASPDDVGRVKESWERAVAEVRPYMCELRLLGADGVYAWHLARGTPIRSEAGGVISWVGTTTDIDDLKRAQEALRGQARWLETVLESVSEGLIATGADGHIRLINSAAGITVWGVGEAVGPPARGGVSHRRRIDPPAP